MKTQKETYNAFSQTGNIENLKLREIIQKNYQK